MEYDKVLDRVRKLIAMAEAPRVKGTTDAEWKATQTEQGRARTQADVLMLKYAITRAEAAAALPECERPKPGRLRFTLCPKGSPFERYILDLSSVVADYCRCTVVWIGSGCDPKTARYYAENYGPDDYHSTVRASVHGFESDLRYFEFLFTVLSLHLSNGLEPKIDPAQSQEENAYALRSAGLSFVDMAKLAGYDPAVDLKHYTYYSGKWKNAYLRELKARGEEQVRIPPSGGVNFRKNFARAYVTEVSARLFEVQSNRLNTGVLVLKSQMDEVRAATNAAHPDAKDIGSAKEPGYNPDAWARGTRHARTADIGSGRVGSPQGSTAIG